MFVVRLLAGLVFFAEGIKRFKFPIELGNRSIRKDPHLSAPSVGVVETVCGLLITFHDAEKTWFAQGIQYWAVQGSTATVRN
jgi:hypothetical protein